MLTTSLSCSCMLLIIDDCMYSVTVRCANLVQSCHETVKTSSFQISVKNSVGVHTIIHVERSVPM